MKELQLGDLVIFDPTLRSSNSLVSPGLVFIVVEKKMTWNRQGAILQPWYFIFSESTGRIGPFMRYELEEFNAREEPENRLGQ